MYISRPTWFVVRNFSILICQDVSSVKINPTSAFCSAPNKISQLTELLVVTIPWFYCKNKQMQMKWQYTLKFDITLQFLAFHSCLAETGLPPESRGPRPAWWLSSTWGPRGSEWCWLCPPPPSSSPARSSFLSGNLGCRHWRNVAEAKPPSRHTENREVRVIFDGNGRQTFSNKNIHHFSFKKRGSLLVWQPLNCEIRFHFFLRLTIQP